MSKLNTVSKRPARRIKTNDGQLVEKKQTAMNQLLFQLKWERRNLPLNNEWEKCYQAIEIAISRHYISYEKEQIEKTWKDATIGGNYKNGEDYYWKTFKPGGEDE